MKNRKLFELNYILNATLFLAFLGNAIVVNLSSDNTSEHFLFVFVFLSLLFILVVAPFNFACYTLNKACKTGLQLSKRADIFGTVCYIFFNILSVLLVIGFIDLINDYFKYSLSTTTRGIFFYSIYFFFTITSVYLSISYWIIKRKFKTQIINMVSALGNKTES
ncbi:hypothetical protein [Ferruginibacter sp. SUN106]|uniref:hypothetical protein n=1 Tax=Ferruginibacter sp. SUN106 TaxID=2978348 RepID=UPI003D36487B